MNDQQQGEADKKLMAVMDDLEKYAERTNEIAAELLAQQPNIHPITATIIAGDILSAEQRTKQVNEGADASELVWLVGSYARWDWTKTMVTMGKISGAWFNENIADLWRSSDPDDTSPENLAIWKQARIANGSYVRDGRPLPKGERGLITVYRGGHPATIRDGFAWTTDPKIARKFAITHGGRMAMSGGVVITGDVHVSRVLAYLTGRREAEVVVDPQFVQNTRVVGVAPMNFNHAICLRCWHEFFAGRDPVRVKEDEPTICAWCGVVTAAGIYVRHDPTTVPMPRESYNSKEPTE